MTNAKHTWSFKASLAGAAEAFIAKVSSSQFAAAQRRRALAGLDAHQLADIGLIYADGDYRPHPDAAKWSPAAESPRHRDAAALPRGAVTP